MPGAKGRSGGHRSGAGRKASEGRVLNLLGGRDRMPVEPVLPVPVACPEGVEPTVMAVWDELAPHAVKARTLVPSTVPAFVRLCRAVVKHAEMEAVVVKDGLTYLKYTADPSGTEHAEVKAHPLIARAASLENTIRAWLKDFAIHPFGKPLAEASPKTVDPFAKFGATG